MSIHSRFVDHEGNKIVKQAFKKHFTDFHVTVIGKVVKVLDDDDTGIPHQRFLIKLPGTQQTILIVHNLDYGGRLHLALGDTFKISGEYVWNRLGGLIHLTHYDPYQNFEAGSADIIHEIHLNPRPTLDS